ncbi:hypothetical protein CONLIGDRAFT_677274 [Coniochaeta ligniaria NRRL 30616]|uniref:Small secreted protein n=1 Tax=Coniochaeta ligniaria NRRL 30616 TaxID=1408157 RepID=A0A1J7JVR9_9PEZI|nr:hypothetical protein CONLIGDRAFT_677274 [Coniochaeta ligniaria NRRL 30616]
MKSIIFAALALASSAAASWGSVEFCVNSPDDNPGYNCATYTFNDNGCFELPQTDGSWHHPNLRGRTHYVAPSSGILCYAYFDIGCTGWNYAVNVSSQHRFEHTISSVTCRLWTTRDDTSNSNTG